MAFGKIDKYAIIIGPIIINECLDRGFEINTSKVMKLLYYMQKLHVQKYGEPMFTNEIVAGEGGPYISDIANMFPWGVLGFDKKIEDICTTLLDSHEDVASIVLEEFGALTPMELMKKSLEDNVFKTIWQDGLGKNQIIPYYVMANSRSDFNRKTLSKNNKRRF